MKPLAIQPTDDQPTPGDLHTRVSGDRLLVPKELARALEVDGVRTAADLIAYLDAFPSAIAERLRWSNSDVRQAAARLRVQLKGRIDDVHLNPPARRNPALGARDPDELDGPAEKRH